ncbi:MAG: hypothetical protein ABI380_08485 [Edaphobacter sp.]
MKSVGRVAPEIGIAMAGGSVDRGQRPAAAMLFEMAHEAGGVPAVKALYVAPAPSLAEIHAVVSRVLGIPWSEVEERWRENILRH